MKRRGGASGKRAQASSSKVARKRRPARAPAGRRKPSQTVVQLELPNPTRELNDALEQLTATSEVMHLMSGSNVDLARVFDSILANAARLGEASFGLLTLYEGDGRF